MPNAVLSWVPVRTGTVRVGNQARRFSNTCFATIPVASAQPAASGSVLTFGDPLVCWGSAALASAVVNVVAEGQER